MSERTIEAIQFGPDGIRLSYMGANDVRAEGAIYQAHTISVAWGAPELEDEMSDLEKAANELLAAALGTWARTRPIDLVAEREAALAELEDDRGLGS